MPLPSTASASPRACGGCSACACRENWGPRGCYGGGTPPLRLALGVFELLDQADDVAVVRVHAVDLHEGLLRVVGVADFHVGRAEVVEESDVLLLGDLRHLHALAIPLDRELRHPLLQETEAEHRGALDGALGVLRGELELADGLV